MTATARHSATETSSPLLAMLDDNHDGRVSMDEYLSPAVESLVKPPLTDGLNHAKVLGWYENLFNKADVDNDGSLDVAELKYLGILVKEAVAQVFPSRQQREIERAKEVEREWQGAMLKELRMRRAMELFEDVDSNGDGVVDRREHLRAMRGICWELGLGDVDSGLAQWIVAIFITADVDNDGELDEDEVEFLIHLITDELRSGAFADKRLLTSMSDADLGDLVASARLAVGVPGGLLEEAAAAAAAARRASGPREPARLLFSSGVLRPERSHPRASAE